MCHPLKQATTLLQWTDRQKNRWTDRWQQSDLYGQTAYAAETRNISTMRDKFSPITQ